MIQADLSGRERQYEKDKATPQISCSICACRFAGRRGPEVRRRGRMNPNLDKS